MFQFEYNSKEGLPLPYNTPFVYWFNYQFPHEGVLDRAYNTVNYAEVYSKTLESLGKGISYGTPTDSLDVTYQEVHNPYFDTAYAKDDVVAGNGTLRSSAVEISFDRVSFARKGYDTLRHHYAHDTLAHIGTQAFTPTGISHTGFYQMPIVGMACAVAFIGLMKWFDFKSKVVQATTA